MRRLVLAALAGNLAACLLFTSLDDTSGGGEPANDASTNEAGPGGDGGADAPASIDGGSDVAVADGGRFCSGDAGYFCADFDDPPLDTGWSGLSTGVGTVSFDNKSLLAEAPITADYEV